ncbi:unnamed protein product [Allacma fusca]|uniref:Uncharacterized protein n=1 Tax=Allacma fusca TaxID=39272 RepID=A0A8J2KT31_9HEXA|nr:unnamed protein product [Allacma fusca]
MGGVQVYFLFLIILPSGFSLVRTCFKYDDGSKLRCVKELTGMNGDNFGRVGIINKSKCPTVRYMKQEWSTPCGSLSGDEAVLKRVFPGEVLQFGHFQQDMVQDFIQLGSCGELKILDCMCGHRRVKCADVLWVATYKRGEHSILLDRFHSSQGTSQKFTEFE